VVVQFNGAFEMFPSNSLEMAEKMVRGRPTRLEYGLYLKRGTIERFFAWLNMGFRKIASRYERFNVVFKGLLDIVCFLLCLKKF
jgi:transposase